MQEFAALPHGFFFELAWYFLHQVPVMSLLREGA